MRALASVSIFAVVLLAAADKPPATSRTRQAVAKAKGGGTVDTRKSEYEAVAVKVDRMLLTRGVQGYPVADRVRLYATTVKDGERLIIGWAARPSWSYAGTFKEGNRDEKYPDSWAAGFYFVDEEKMPSRVSTVIDASCDQFNFVYSVDRNVFYPCGCIK